MDFSERALDICRLNVTRYQVVVLTDRFGNGNILEGIGADGNNYIREARWLPNEEIEVVFNGGEIRHYTSLNNWYAAGYNG